MLKNIIEEIVYSDNNDFYHLESNYRIIYIPSIEIVNQHKNSLLLTDVFININENDGSFSLMRLSRTHLESLNNYIHSHASGGDLNIFHSVCTGKSPYKTLYKRFLKSGKKLDFLLYWNCVLDIVSYESLLGGPYHRIENFIPYNKVKPVSISANFFSKRPFVSYKLKGNGVYSFYNISEVLKYNPTVVCNYIDGEYYSSVCNYVFNNTLEVDKDIYRTVTNGKETKKIYKTILPDRKYSNSGKTESRINPYLKKEIDEYVTKKVKRFNTLNKITRKLSTYNRGESIESDKTLLC